MRKLIGIKRQDKIPDTVALTRANLPSIEASTPNGLPFANIFHARFQCFLVSDKVLLLFHHKVQLGVVCLSMILHPALSDNVSDRSYLGTEQFRAEDGTLWYTKR